MLKSRNFVYELQKVKAYIAPKIVLLTVIKLYCKNWLLTLLEP